MYDFDDAEGFDSTSENFESFDDNVLETFGTSGSCDEVFEELTSGLNAEDMSYIKSELEAGNQDMMDLFGVNEDVSEADGDVKVLTK